MVCGCLGDVAGCGGDGGCGEGGCGAFIAQDSLILNRLAIRYVSSEEVYILADGLHTFVKMDSEVRAWLALFFSVAHV